VFHLNVRRPTALRLTVAHMTFPKNVFRAFPYLFPLPVAPTSKKTGRLRNTAGDIEEVQNASINLHRNATAPVHGREICNRSRPHD
jgi:hypothetical protein